MSAPNSVHVSLSLATLEQFLWTAHLHNDILDGGVGEGMERVYSRYVWITLYLVDCILAAVQLQTVTQVEICIIVLCYVSEAYEERHWDKSSTVGFCSHNYVAMCRYISNILFCRHINFDAVDTSSQMRIYTSLLDTFPS